MSLATINAPEVLDGSIQALVAARDAGMHAGVTARTDVLGNRSYWGGIVNRRGTLFGELWLIAVGRVTSAINAAGRFGIRASRGAVIEQVTTT